MTRTYNPLRYYPPVERMRLIQEMRSRGLRTAGIAEAFGVSVATLRWHMRRYAHISPECAPKENIGSPSGTPFRVPGCLHPDTPIKAPAPATAISWVAAARSPGRFAASLRALWNKVFFLKPAGPRRGARLRGVGTRDANRAEGMRWYMACRHVSLYTNTPLCDVYRAFGVGPTTVTDIKRGTRRLPEKWQEVLQRLLDGIPNA